MVSRRQVLIEGGLAGAAIACAPVAAAGREAGRAVSLFLVDRTIGGILAGLGPVTEAGVPLAFFAGDIGVPWMESIEPMWRRTPASIAGITDDGALFCLEQLGAHFSLTCTLRVAVPPAGPRAFEAAGRSLLRAAALGQPRLRPLAQTQGRPVAWLLQPKTRIA